MLLSLGYTDLRYIDFFLSELDQDIVFKDIPSVLIAKLIPFVYEFPEEYKMLQKKLFQEHNSFLIYLKGKSLQSIFINGKLSTKAIEVK